MNFRLQWNIKETLYKQKVILIGTGKVYRAVYDFLARKKSIKLYGNQGNEIPFKRIHAINPDLLICACFPKLLPKEIYNKYRCVNFHLGYLPYNRGANPNVWSIIEKTPPGVTIHNIDGGIDTGKYLVRKKVKTGIEDTAFILHRKLLDSIISLFKDNWENIKNNRIRAKKYQEKCTFHLRKDFKKLSQIDGNKKVKVQDLIDLLRAKSFTGHPGLHVVIGKNIYDVTINIKKVNQKNK
ncbi:MAG: formyltransferase family protein [bacterium]